MVLYLLFLKQLCLIFCTRVRNSTSTAPRESRHANPKHYEMRGFQFRVPCDVMCRNGYHTCQRVPMIA